MLLCYVRDVRILKSINYPTSKQHNNSRPHLLLSKLSKFNEEENGIIKFDDDDEVGG